MRCLSPQVLSLIEKLNIKVAMRGDHPCYKRRVYQGASGGYLIDLDTIVLSEDADLPDYTVLHEIVHWTGHESRIHRDFGSGLFDFAYCYEEHIAELGAVKLALLLDLPGASDIIIKAEEYLTWYPIPEHFKAEANRAASYAVDWLMENSKLIELKQQAVVA